MILQLQELLLGVVLDLRIPRALEIIVILYQIFHPLGKTFHLQQVQHQPRILHPDGQLSDVSRACNLQRLLS